MGLHGKVALVTGSTSGIGLSIVLSLATEGADIMMSGFGDADKIEKLRIDLSLEFSVNIIHDAADLSQPNQVVDIVRRTQSSLETLTSW